MKFNGKNTYISPKARIGLDVQIGDNTVIYDNVMIGDGTIVADNCIIGEPTAAYYSDIEYYKNPPTIIGSNCLFRSNSIIYAGSEFGNRFTTGHRVTIRENTKFGDNAKVGTLTDIQGNCKFGDHCWLHSNVFVSQGCKIGNFVFIYPNVVLTNDPTPPSNILMAIEIHDFAQLAASCTILPGVKIGTHALIGAGSIVTQNVEEYMLVAGNPAKPIKDVRQIKSPETGESHYPWPYKFEREMPWAGIGFDNWLQKKSIQ